MKIASGIRGSSPFVLLILLVALGGTVAVASEEKRAGGNSVELGFEERVRTENWDNVFDYNEDTTPKGDFTHQLRFRTKLWSKFTFGTKAELMVMLNNESRKVFTPDTPFKWDEVIFESLYLDLKPGGRWSARIGRQNLMRGDGVVLFDGNSGDGSRTAYFNAVDATYSFGKSKVEFIGISDPHRDEYLPRFNDKEKLLTEWDERAVGAYYTGKEIAKTAIEGYYFYKTETGDTRPDTNPARQEDRRFHTLGGRVVRAFGRGWSTTDEAAVQWGESDPDTAIRAWALIAMVRRAFDVAAKPSVSLAWIGLSGDDPATGKIEGWDPLFSRWPLWSELYIYSQLKEKGIAYWTNLGMWQAEALATPAKPLALRATYYKMSAFHPFPGDPAIFGTGKDRGDLFQFRADVAAGKHFKGHVLWEHLSPGDFYAGHDPAWFFRVEVIYTLKHSITL